jgi:hypothetical protein
MKSRITINADISLELSGDEAETLLAELRIVRDNNENEFGAVSSRLIDELESCIDELEIAEDEDEDEDEDSDPDEDEDMES